MSEGVLRKPVSFMVGPPSGTGEPWSGPAGVGSEAKAKAATWQVAQDCCPDTDRVLSLKIFSPSCAAADNAGGVGATPPPDPDEEPLPPQAARARSPTATDRRTGTQKCRANLDFMLFDLRRASRPTRP